MFACPACCPHLSVPLSTSAICMCVCFFFVCSFQWMYFTFSTFCAIFPVWPSYIFTLSSSIAGNSNFLKCHCIVSGASRGWYIYIFEWMFGNMCHILVVRMVNIHLFPISHVPFNKLIEKLYTFPLKSWLPTHFHFVLKKSKSQVSLWVGNFKGVFPIACHAFWGAVCCEGKALSWALRRIKLWKGNECEKMEGKTDLLGDWGTAACPHARSRCQLRRRRRWGNGVMAVETGK